MIFNHDMDNSLHMNWYILSEIIKYEEHACARHFAIGNADDNGNYGYDNNNNDKGIFFFNILHEKSSIHSTPFGAYSEK